MTETALARNAQGAPSARPGRRFSLTWLGLVPFLVFSTLFLLIPTAYLIVGSFVDSTTGDVTLQNYARLTEGLQLNAYLTSIEISLVTALAGGIFGFLMAYAVISGGPRRLRGPLMTFSGVASNFAGIPLALAFVFTIGRTGLVTSFLARPRHQPVRRRVHDLFEARPRDRLPVLPAAADDPDHRPSDRWPEARVA